MSTQLSQGRLDACFVAFNAAFARGMGVVSTDYLKYAMLVPSTGATEIFPLSVIDTAMREWAGDRKHTTLDVGDITVHNRDYANSVIVRRNAIEDDSLGFTAALFEALGTAAENLWGDLAIGALTGAGKWADGKDFFGTRKVGKSTITNVTDAAFSLDAYATAYSTMMAYTDAGGSPLKIVPDTLVVGPALRAAAKRVVEAELISNNGATESNTEKGSAELLVDPNLVGDYANDWYLLCTTRGVKPVGVVQRKKGTLTRVDQESAPCVYERNENMYGVHNRGASIATLPWLAYRGGR